MSAVEDRTERLVDEHRAAPGDLVWIAATRRGIEYHRLGGEGFTTCRRSTRTGAVVPLADAVDVVEAKPCPRCVEASGE